MARLDEIASEQFALWEVRGRGWKVWPHPVAPEPPFRPFAGYRLPKPDPELDDGRKPGMLASFFDRIHRSLNPKPAEIPEPKEIEPEPEVLERDRLIELQTLLPASLDISNEAFADFLSQLAVCREPITFELLGMPERIAAQFVSNPTDVPILMRQLKTYFPEVAFLPTENTLLETWDQSHPETAIVEFGLEREFLLSLASGRKLDPFLGIIAAMSELAPGELALFQVIFETTEHDWKRSALRTVQDFEGKPIFIDRPELVDQAEEKFASPLYAAVVRIAAKAEDFDRAWQIARELAFTLRLFARPEGNALIPLHNEQYPLEVHEEDLLLRQSRRNGMLLNTDELMGFVHFPASEVRSPNLVRQSERTKEAPESLTQNRDFVLGDNPHLGGTMPVGLSSDQRVRHTHVIGSPGSGKSTFIFNLIRQDIEAGRGVAVLEPHGDLIERILGCIPKERIDDVVLVDPSDERYSVGFNILAAHSDLEKTLLSSDLVAVFQRLSTSWGDQMGSVLRNAILAFLESSRGGTLSDLQKFLIEPAFREQFLPTVQDPEIVYYWRKGFAQLTGNKSIGPLLTRLSEFLSPKPIRYMVAQKENRLDFAKIMNTGKIFLAKLSQGTMGAENSSLMGSLFMAKFHLSAMARQSLPESARRDFFIYLDEAHNFATPSMVEILTGARKYRVGMVLAHQDLSQLERVKEIGSAVLGSATRVVFRLGDSNDARKLCEGFSFFEAKDLQNLETGQAICRVEKTDWDFNLTVPFPEAIDPAQAVATQQAVIAASRAKYATPRADIEAATRAKLDSVLSDPVPAKAKRISPSLPKDAEPEHSEPPRPTVSEQELTVTAATAPKSPETEAQSVPAKAPEAPITAQAPPPHDLGRGGAQHKAIQERLQAEAHALGFTAGLESQVRKGSKRAADLGLRRGDLTIAVEIAVTTTTDHEFGNVKKCLDAGFNRVAVVSPRSERLKQIRTAVEAGLGLDAASKVSYHTPDDFIAELRKLAAEEGAKHAEPTMPGERITRGFKVRRHGTALNPAERAAKEKGAVQMIVDAMKRAE